MKHRTNRILQASLTVVMACTLLLAVIYIPLQPEAAAEAGQSQEADYPAYVLKDYYGKIAVFETSKDQPDIVFDVYVSTLPEFDQQALQTGVFAQDMKELNRLIEDYTS